MLRGVVLGPIRNSFSDSNGGLGEGGSVLYPHFLFVTPLEAQPSIKVMTPPGVNFEEFTVVVAKESPNALDVP